MTVVHTCITEILGIHWNVFFIMYVYKRYEVSGGRLLISHALRILNTENCRG